MACITEASAGLPGFSARIPFENGTIAEALNERGWNTYAIGKWHLTPGEETDTYSRKGRWPLGRGFERFYGFLGGETNQWYPDLTLDNGPTSQARTPEEGYHLSEDLTDQALKFVLDAEPDLVVVAEAGRVQRQDRGGDVRLGIVGVDMYRGDFGQRHRRPDVHRGRARREDRGLPRGRPARPGPVRPMRDTARRLWVVSPSYRDVPSFLMLREQVLAAVREVYVEAPTDDRGYAVITLSDAGDDRIDVRVREDPERSLAQPAGVLYGGGVVVLGDLGSSVLTVEAALELDESLAERVVLARAPFIEGAVANTAYGRPRSVHSIDVACSPTPTSSSSRPRSRATTPAPRPLPVATEASVVPVGAMARIVSMMPVAVVAERIVPVKLVADDRMAIVDQVGEGCAEQGAADEISDVPVVVRACRPGGEREAKRRGHNDRSSTHDGLLLISSGVSVALEA